MIARLGRQHPERKAAPPCTPCPEKKSLEYFRHNFIKYWPIFEILSPLQSAENLQLDGQGGARREAARPASPSGKSM